jgi:hypothetical protein
MTELTQEICQSSLLLRIGLLVGLLLLLELLTQVLGLIGSALVFLGLGLRLGLVQSLPGGLGLSQLTPAELFGGFFVAVH